MNRPHLPGNTDVYALFGNPVGHSLSPIMHNAAYREMNLDALYVPFCVHELVDAVRGMRALGIRGASVTIPFKTVIMQLLDTVTEAAKTIGAVNTIINRKGLLEGYNTDWIGLKRALEAHFDLAGKTCAILGAGGAARAAVFTVVRGGARPIIVNRTISKARALAEEFGGQAFALSEFARVKADCLINTTSVGMFPNSADSPIADSDLGRFRWVMDMIYNPLETKLLSDAERAGCRIISGLDMFVQQGAEQIRWWTGQEPPLHLMHRVVVEHLIAGERQ